MTKQEVISGDWSPLEIKLLNTVDVFLHKPAIMKKAEANLTVLKQEIVKTLSLLPHSCPPEADIVKGQIVRGENHNGFPFMSLDMPQMFSKSRMFTYRTLFWWGHGLIFSLILKQENIGPLIEKLIQLKEHPEWKDIELAIAPTPWEWKKDTNNFIPLSETSEIRIKNIINSVQYIKLCRFYSLANPEFPKLNWTNAGLTNWKTLSEVCSV
ncbi:MAG: hypothetical protein HOB32_05575 [Nitrospina sp.]|jgi:hypothetical protein|nr:hypothetical protein [Nitrospina sp.]